MAKMLLSLKGLKAHPYWSLTAAVTFTGFLWDGINDHLSGSSLMEAWLGPDWLTLVVKSPWFTVAGLTLCCACLWRIGGLAANEEAAAALRETEARNRAMEFPLETLACLKRIAGRNRAEDGARELNKEIAHYRHLADVLRYGGEVPISHYDQDALVLQAEKIVRIIFRIEANLGDVNRSNSQFKSPNRHMTAMAPSIGRPISRA